VTEPPPTMPTQTTPSPITTTTTTATEAPTPEATTGNLDDIKTNNTIGEQVKLARHYQISFSKIYSPMQRKP